MDQSQRQQQAQLYLQQHELFGINNPSVGNSCSSSTQGTVAQSTSSPAPSQTTPSQQQSGVSLLSNTVASLPSTAVQSQHLQQSQSQIITSTSISITTSTAVTTSHSLGLASASIVPATGKISAAAGASTPNTNVDIATTPGTAVVISGTAVVSIAAAGNSAAGSNPVPTSSTNTNVTSLITTSNGGSCGTITASAATIATGASAVANTVSSVLGNVIRHPTNVLPMGASVGPAGGMQPPGVATATNAVTLTQTTPAVSAISGTGTGPSDVAVANSVVAANTVVPTSRPQSQQSIGPGVGGGSGLISPGVNNPATCCSDADGVNKIPNSDSGSPTTVTGKVATGSTAASTTISVATPVTAPTPALPGAVNSSSSTISGINSAGGVGGTLMNMSNNSCNGSNNNNNNIGGIAVGANSATGSALRRPEDVLRVTGQNDKLKFTMLIGLLQATPEQAGKDVVHTVLHLLVGGEFDMELNFVINNPNNIIYMLELLDHSSTQLQAELWSVLCAMLKKSVRNLQACTEVHLIEHILARMAHVDQVVADLVIEVLGVLANYSITVRELKLLVGYLRASGATWGPHSVRLLSVLRALPHRTGPDSFFSFSGKKGSAIAIPPLSRWPYQSGWTLCTWFRLDPVNSVSIEREKPYLYCFRTSKAVGYSAHFVGNCLIFTSMKVKGKGYQHCVKYEFQPRRWYMLAVVYIYNRWSKSEIKCFVNGQLASATEMSWLVSTNDPFDKCYIGASPELDEEHLFSGQMSAVYLFSEALSTHQVCGIHRLGPGYQAQFRFEGESPTLSESLRRVLYDGKLAQAMLFCYNPVATDSQLCLQAAPKTPGGVSGGAAFFVHNPHALMLQEVRAVTTHGIHSTLNSIGGLQMLFPLLGQLDYPVQGVEHDVNTAKANGICATLIGFICEMCEGSTAVQQHMIQNKGFLVISQQLRKALRHHLNESVLQSFLSLVRHLLTLSTANGELLLKHLLDHVLFNPALWIYTPTPIQIRLYSYLATEFLADTQIYGNVRRVSTVLQTMHILKYYYWVTNPSEKSGIVPKGADGPRPAPPEILSIRAYLLLFLKQLIVKGSGPKEDELQSCLNYLTTVHEDDNLHDVLQMMIGLMAEQPATMVPAFDCRAGVRAVFKLLGSPSETVRLQALKLLAFFLSRSTHKRKHDVMSPHNLYMLLVDRLLLHADHLTLATYNVLYEMLTEHIGAHILYTPHAEPEHHFRLENPMVLKVIASLLRQSKACDELMEVKRLFLSDLSLLCNASRENRRTVLQMSVWQEWLVALAYVHPQDQEQRRISETVFALFRALLHHAIKYEYGGWRVWVDTLAIVHSRVAFEEYQLHYAQMQSAPAALRESPSPADETVPGVSTGGQIALTNAPSVRVLGVALSATTPSQELPAPSLAEAVSSATAGVGSNQPSSTGVGGNPMAPVSYCSSAQQHNMPSTTSSSPSTADISISSSSFSAHNQQTQHLSQPSPPQPSASAVQDQQTVDGAPCSDHQSYNGITNHHSQHQHDHLQAYRGQQISSSLASSPERGSRGSVETAGPLQVEQVVITEDGQVVCTAGSQETIEEKSDDGTEKELHADAKERCQGVGEATDIKDQQQSVDRQQATLTTITTTAFIASNDEEEAATTQGSQKVKVKHTEEQQRVAQGERSLDAMKDTIGCQIATEASAAANDVLRSEETTNNGVVAHTKDEQEPKLSSSTKIPDSTEDLPGIHRAPTTPCRRSSAMAASEVETSAATITDSGRGASEHNEDSSVIINKDQLTSVVTKDAVPEAEMKVLEDVSLSEEEERDSSGSPQMIDCPAIESPAPSHTSQVSAGSGIEHEPQEDDGREKHENEGEKEIPMDAALVTELSCDTIESSSMPLSPLLEKKAAEQNAKSQPPPTSDVVEIKEVSGEVETVDITNSANNNNNNVGGREGRGGCIKNENHEAVLGSNGKESGSAIETGERLAGDSGSAGSPEQVVSTIDAQLQHSSYRGLEVAKDKVTGLQSDGAERATLEDLGPDGAEPAKLRTKSVSFANVNDTYESVYPPGHGNGTGVSSSNNSRENSSHAASRHLFNSGPSRPPFRIPEFRWSAIHQRLLSDLLYSLETDIQLWRSHSTKTIMDFVNSSDNAIFVVNTVHLISQLSDNIVIACGGLLPLLAAATSPTHELDVVEPTQGLSSEMSFAFLQRLVHLADVLVFASSLSFSELESEKNMASGGILRQCLRLVCTNAVRTCLDGRIKLPAPSPPAQSSGSTGHHHGHGVSSQVQTNHAMASALQRMRNDLSGSLMQVKEPEKLLQDMDVNRLRAVIYRDDETKQAQFLALAVVYFISVLMVSKYRDILEPASPHAERRDREQQQRTAYENNGRTTASSCHHSHIGHGHGTSGEDSDILANLHSSSIPIIPKQHLGQGHSSTHAYCHQRNAHLSSVSDEAHGGSNKNGDFTRAGQGSQGNGESREPSLTQKLETALCGVCPLLREIMVDFAQFLSKTLVGSHGQDLLVEGKGLNTFKNSSSVVELVMLLCSQEWQNSLQKHAGLAFIELINEGRLLSHAMKDHIVRVANEADFILNRMRADDVIKHADFEQLCGQTAAERRDEESMCDHLITAARRRDTVVAQRMIDKVHNMLTNRHGAWRDQQQMQQARTLALRGRCGVGGGQGSPQFTPTATAGTACTNNNKNNSAPAIVTVTNLAGGKDGLTNHSVPTVTTASNVAIDTSTNRTRVDFERIEHLKLDSWEDDARRRRRFVRNPLGSPHHGASLRAEHAHGHNDDAATVSRDREELHRQLAAQRRQNGSPGGELTGGQAADGAEYWEDKELDAEYTGSVSLSTRCRLIAPGITAPGTLSVTQSELFFEVDEDDAEFKKNCPRVLKYCEHVHGKWHFSEIRAVFSRRYLLQNVALEIFLASRTSIMFAFDSAKTVKRVVKALPQVGVGIKYGIGQTRRASLMTPRQIFQQSNMTQKWQRREISNFEYLMFLNTIAGRTYSDLNQYPIFPWVLTNYESAELDLSLPSNYRDLSKPIGALNPSRKQFFEERYESWEHDVVPPFHYGTHYSTAAFTLNWLLRLEPFATMFLALQDGKFDHPDRLFSSVGQSWRNCQRDTSDVKELIPEFFYLPEIFQNHNGFRLGTREDGHLVSDVQLPPWANGSAEEFVRIHRMALESEIVSCQLHQWIDLIFGYKQRGPEAVRSANVFYYLTYEGNVELESVKDPVMREAIEEQIKNFGMTPSQLLLEPHPPRSSAMHISPLMFSPVADEVCMVIKFLSNSPIVHISANTYPQLPAPSVVTVAANHNFAVNRWNPNFSTPLHGGGGGPTGSYHHDVSSQSGPGQQNSQVLPLSMDPLLMMNVSPHKRHLGDSDFSQRLKVRPSCFVTTVDSRFIIAAGFWDKSFRVFATESAKTLQIVYAHFGVVTCLARSECNITSDCYVASGSEDCTVLLWHWNARTQSIAGDNANPDVPTPRASLSGHESEVTCIVVSAELGLVVSGSRSGAVLVHTTAGDLLRSVQGPEHFRSPHLVCLSREGTMVLCYDLSNVCAFNMNGKQLRAVTHHDDIGCCALSRDGEYLITGGESGVVEVWRTYNLALLYAFPACEGAVRSVALSHDQRFLITGLSNGSITVFYIDFNRWHHEYQQRY